MRILLALFFVLCLCAGELAAQQTIINVPSDALTPKGQFFALHESQIAPSSSKATYATTNFLTYGLTDNTELAATLYGVDNQGSDYAALGLGFKSTYDVLQEVIPDLEPKWTYGFMLPISNNQQHNTVGWFPYSHLTLLVPETKLRILGGVACGSENLFGENTVSALAGAEFEITEHLAFTGEWFSGKHNFSGLIPGFTYHQDNLILVVGYKIPNDFNLRDSGLVMEVGSFFGRKSGTPASLGKIHYGVWE